MSNYNRNLNIILTFAIGYLIAGILAIFRLSINTFDFLAASFCLGIIYFNGNKWKINFWSAIFILSAFLMHSIGMIFLYAISPFRIPGDYYVHFFAAFFGAIAICIFLKERKFGIVAITIIAIFAILAIGSMVETSEYIGFKIVGYGPGILGFGEGDNSQYFGAWENIQMDLLNNLLGGVSGAVVYYGSSKINNSNNKIRLKNA